MDSKPNFLQRIFKFTSFKGWGGGGGAFACIGSTWPDSCHSIVVVITEMCVCVFVHVGTCRGILACSSG